MSSVSSVGLYTKSLTYNEFDIRPISVKFDLIKIFNTKTFVDFILRSDFLAKTTLSS